MTQVAKQKYELSTGVLPPLPQCCTRQDFETLSADQYSCRNPDTPSRNSGKHGHACERHDLGKPVAGKVKNSSVTRNAGSLCNCVLTAPPKKD